MTDKTIPAKKVISEDSAKAQVAAFLDCCGVAVKDIELEDGVDAVNTMLNGLIRAICDGRLSIDTDPELDIRFTLERPIGDVSELHIVDRVAKGKIAMDKEGKNLELRKTAFMAVMADTNAGVLIQLRVKDLAIVNRLSTIFSLV